MKPIDIVFEEVVTIMENRWHVQPTLYASYAVAEIVGPSITARDLDILVPEIVLAQRQQFITAFEEAGFTPIAGPVLTLRKNGIDVEFSPYEYWQERCHFDVSLDVEHTQPAAYKRLGVANLMSLYAYLLHDELRDESKRRKDITKLEALHLAYEKGLR